MTDTWPEEIKPGVRVRAEKKDGATVHEFTIAQIDPDHELIAVGGADGYKTGFGVYPSDFIVTVIRAPLPVAAGVYVDNHDEYWLIPQDGAGLHHWPKIAVRPEPLDPEVHADAAEPLTFRRLIIQGEPA